MKNKIEPVDACYLEAYYFKKPDSAPEEVIILGFYKDSRFAEVQTTDGIKVINIHHLKFPTP
jgi:hypothetical protein